MMKGSKFEIPIKDKIKEFGYHLKSHPRTILSAKFGDGKTYFLSEFIKKRNRSFVFITLHPINYQVLENKDIFELIKRDILFQITVNGMLSEDLVVSDKTALLFYAQNNYMGIAESLMSIFNQLNSSPETIKCISAALSTHKFLKVLKNKVSDLKKKYKTVDALEDYMDKTGSIPVIEEDIITKIIHDSIDDFKKHNPRKRLVLMIEDMDRLDPAHLFRIMNVFSAHMDTDEKFFIKSHKEFFYNKFHFDNVLFVMDYNNTRKIFEHFYGENTNFEGYIQKFISKGYFKYSLEELKCNYIQKRIAEITELPIKYIEGVMSNDVLLGKNIRVIIDSFDDVDSQIKKRPVYNGKYIHLGVVRLFIIMKRLNIDDNLLINSYRNLSEELKKDILSYIIGYVALLSGEKDAFDCKDIFEIDHSYNVVITRYDIKTQLFTPDIRNYISASNERSLISFNSWPTVLNSFVAE